MTPIYDFVVLTDDKFIQTPGNWQIQNGWQEDHLVMQALEHKGFRVARKSWADPEFNWSDTRAAIFRTTWDYFHRFDEWLAWLEHVTTQTRLINPIEMVRWNMDKHYLGELANRGINIPQTRYIEIGESLSLAALYEETGWTETILKPCIAGSARHTYRMNPDTLKAHEATFQQLIAKEAMMLQPFQKNVVSQGEISIMLMGGTYTHAVIKNAKPGDFRVQDDFGGTVKKYEPSPEEIAFAEKAVAACPALPAYARVDIIRDNDDQLALIELELIEPELWFRLHPEAATVLAEHLHTIWS